MLRRAIGAAHHASLRPTARRFAQAMERPAAAQEERRTAILATLAGSRHADAIGLRAGMTLDAFQRLPISDYALLAPSIERIAQGEQNVLSREPVKWLERSGGSSGPSKLVPFTAGFLAEMQQATNPWIWDLQGDPHIRRRPSYWSLSPVAQGPRKTAGGVPIGTQDDAEYFGPVAAWAIRKMLAVPAEVAQIPDLAAWRAATLRHLVAEESLGLVSVWSPSFLTLLLDALEADPGLLAGLPPRRRRRVEARQAAGATLAEALWPHLCLSCWTDGASGSPELLGALRRHLPNAWLQGKGLLATEGVVSIPWRDAEAPVLAVRSHFLEFLDVAHPDRTPRLAQELQPGGLYSPLLTTSAGLVRYHLRDRVRCVGRHDGTPTVRFEGRLDAVSDLCGEKVHEDQARAALQATAASPRFALLVPDLSPPRYVLVAEGVTQAEARRMAAAADAHLRQAHPYDYARSLGQLGPVEPRVVADGWDRLLALRTAQGARVGDVKPTALGRVGWLEAFR